MNLKREDKTVFLLILLFFIAVSVPAFYPMQVTTSVWAESGYWEDIQDAVNDVSLLGGGSVYIPEGNWNFVNVGESWTGPKVTIPAGINVMGAPTQRTSGLVYDGVGQNPNGQVVEWETVLVMPWDVAGGREGYRTWFFRVDGNGDPDKSTRISDIKFVGYREIDETCESWHGAIEIQNVAGWRVDHCWFQHCTGGSVYVTSPSGGMLKGVVDHCKLINTYGYVEWWYADCSVCYGIHLKQSGTQEWEDDITKVLGHYNDNTVFIEDCYFSRWRHCICSLDNGHWVFRHNTIEYDSIVGSLDLHGTYNYVGSRAAEIYNNLIIDPVMNKHPENWDSTTPANGGDGTALNWRGGGGVFFNNYVRNYRFGIIMIDEGDVQKCYPHDIWIWGNTWVNIGYKPVSVTSGGHYQITEGVDYFLYEPAWYSPYIYPHPLVSGSSDEPPPEENEEPLPDNGEPLPAENDTTSEDYTPPSPEFPSVPLENIKEASHIFIIEIGLTVLAIVVFIQGRRKHA